MEKERLVAVVRTGRMSGEAAGASVGGASNPEQEELCVRATSDISTRALHSSETQVSVPDFMTETSAQPTEEGLCGNPNEETTLSTLETPVGRSLCPPQKGVVNHICSHASNSGISQVGAFSAVCTGLTSRQAGTEPDSCTDRTPENVLSSLSSAESKDGRVRACGGSPVSPGKLLQLEGSEQSSQGASAEAQRGDAGTRLQQESLCRLRWCLYNVKAILNRLASAESVVSPPFDAQCVGGPLYIRLEPVHPPAEETCDRNSNRSLSCGARSIGPTVFSSATKPSTGQGEGLPLGIQKKGGKSASQRFAGRSLGVEKTAFEWETCRFGIFVACCARVTMEFSIHIVERSVRNHLPREGDKRETPQEGGVSPSFRTLDAEQSANCEDAGAIPGGPDAEQAAAGVEVDGEPGRVLVDSGRCLYSSREQTLWHGVRDLAALSSAADRDENLLIVDVVIHSATVEPTPLEAVKTEAGDGPVEERGKAQVGRVDRGSSADSPTAGRRMAADPNAFLCDAALNSTRLVLESEGSEERAPASAADAGILKAVSNSSAGAPPAAEEKRLGRSGGANPRVHKHSRAGRASATGEGSLEADAGSGRRRGQQSSRLAVDDAVQTAVRPDVLPSQAGVEKAGAGSAEGLVGRQSGAKSRAGWNPRGKGAPDSSGTEALKAEGTHCGPVGAGLGKRRGMRPLQAARAQGVVRGTSGGTGRGSSGCEAALPSSPEQDFPRLQGTETLEPEGNTETVATGRRGEELGRSAGARRADSQQCMQVGGDGGGPANASARKKREKQRQRRRRGSNASRMGGDVARVLAAWSTSRNMDCPADSERLGAAIENILQAQSASSSASIGSRPSPWGGSEGHSAALSTVWARGHGPHGSGEETGRNVKTTQSRLQPNSALPPDPTGIALSQQWRFREGAAQPFVQATSQVCARASCQSEEGRWEIDTNRGGGHTLSALNMLLSLAGRDGTDAFGQSVMSPRPSQSPSQLPGGGPSPYLPSPFQEKLACGVAHGGRGDQRGEWNPAFAEGADPRVAPTRGKGVFLEQQNSYGRVSLGRGFQEAGAGLGARGRNFPVAPPPGLPPASRVGLGRGDVPDVSGSVPMPASTLTASLTDNAHEPPVLVQYARALQAAAASPPSAQQQISGAEEDASSGPGFSADRLPGVDLQRGLSQDVLASRQRFNERVHGQETLDGVYPSGNRRESSVAPRGSSFYSPGLTALEEADREEASRRLARVLLGDCAIPESPLGVCLSNNDATDIPAAHVPTPAAAEQNPQFLWRQPQPDTQPPEGRYAGSAGGGVSSVVATALGLAVGSRGLGGNLVSSSLNVVDADVARFRRREGLSFDRGLICGLFSHPIARYPDEGTHGESGLLGQHLTAQAPPEMKSAFEQQVQTLGGMRDGYSRTPHSPYDASRPSYAPCDARVPQVDEDLPGENEVTREYALQYLAENIGRIRRDTAEYDSLVGRSSSSLRGHSVTVAMLPRTPFRLSGDSQIGDTALPEVPASEE